MSALRTLKYIGGVWDGVNWKFPFYRGDGSAVLMTPDDWLLARRKAAEELATLRDAKRILIDRIERLERAR